MAVTRAWYVMCDSCGNPAAVATEGSGDALRQARLEGFARKRIDGQLTDLCPTCARASLSDEEWATSPLSAEHPEGDTQ